MALVLLVLCAVAVLHAQDASVPLRLTLVCDRAPALAFRFTVQNVSATPGAAIIGDIIGNQEYQASVTLTGRRPGVPDTMLNVPNGPVAGSVGPWLITLAPGTSFSRAYQPRSFVNRRHRGHLKGRRLPGPLRRSCI
jgi:hypothetical protein